MDITISSPGILGTFPVTDLDSLLITPSGTGNALPFSCYPSAAERAASFLGSALFGNSSDVANGRLWAEGTNYAAACEKVNGSIGGLIGTAFTARDMMQIVDAIETDGMLRYWGKP